LNEKLKVLDALQKVDLAILELQKNGESHPKRLAELETELKAAKSAWDAEESRLEDNDRQKKELDTRLSDEKEKVKKWEARLTEQRTTREYSQLAREIDIAKKTNITVGEELGELGKVRDALETQALAKQQAYDAKQRTVGVEANDLKKKIGELDGRIKELSEKRKAAAAAVDPALLARYESIHRRRNPAMVPVRDGTCIGCRMKIPPQLYNQLRTGLPFDVCRSCARIIYVEDAAQQG
jgi:predicted  nucleic acid-binding Zn-ribbon protein